MKKIIAIILVIIAIIGIVFITNKINYNKKNSQIEKNIIANLEKIEAKNTEDAKKTTEEMESFKIEIEELSNDEEAIKENVRRLNFVGIGDSVFEDALSEIKAVLPNGYYDAKISRPLVTGNEILRTLKNQGKLTDIIVLGLANNGFYSEKRCQELMEIVGNRTVYWLNSVGPDDPSYNAKFKEFAKNYPNIHIMDWEETSKGHSEYFYRDGTHLKPEGLKAYARMIFNYLYEDYKQSLVSKVEEKQKELEEANKQRLALYGNDLLISAASKIYEKDNNAVLIANRKYNFDKLYKDIKEKLDNNLLEYNIVFMLDEKAKISKKQYQSLIELCGDRNIYIVNVTASKLTFENANVKVINYHDKLGKNKEYLEFDKIHLSLKGINYVVSELFNSIETK